MTTPRLLARLGLHSVVLASALLGVAHAAPAARSWTAKGTRFTTTSRVDTHGRRAWTRTSAGVGSPVSRKTGSAQSVYSGMPTYQHANEKVGLETEVERLATLAAAKQQTVRIVHAGFEVRVDPAKKGNTADRERQISAALDRYAE